MSAEPAGKGELRLCARLGLEGVEVESLLAAMRAGKSSRGAVVLTALAPQDYVPPFPCAELAAPWLPPRVYVPEPGVKPTAHEDYTRGLYYSLDLSSCWESACLAVVPPPASSLDMCAAPGGKTMLVHFTGRCTGQKESVKLSGVCVGQRQAF